MPCYHIGNAIISTTNQYRLRLGNGGYVWMDWHNYLGPLFFRDRLLTRELEFWYEDPYICEALDWFLERKCKA